MNYFLATITLLSIVATINAYIDGPCVDDPKTNCASLTGYCHIPQYIPRMESLCPKTCKFCGPCEDDPKTNCDTQVENCKNELLRHVMEIYCPKTCGYCK